MTPVSWVGQRRKWAKQNPAVYEVVVCFLIIFVCFLTCIVCIFLFDRFCFLCFPSHLTDGVIYMTSVS